MTIETSRFSEATPSAAFTFTVPRLFALAADDLMRIAPDRAMNVIASRSILEKSINVVCGAPLPSPAVVPTIPQSIDFGVCRHLSLIETKNNILVRFCDDTADHAVIYQTPITKQMWRATKSFLEAATHSATASMALRT